VRVDFIRHGKTEGNLEMRYVGRTDEPLSFSGIAELMKTDYPPCGVLITSPMKRCIQTAELIYPGKAPIICEELRECDFGAFEGRNYIELSTDSRYQKWIDSGGVSAFPEGGGPCGFQGALRCRLSCVNSKGARGEQCHIRSPRRHYYGDT